MRNISIILMLLFLNGCISQKEDKLASIVLIPKPQQIERHEGHLALDNYSTLYADKEFKIAEDFLRKFLQNGTRWEFQAVEKAIATIKIEKNTSLPPEGYSLFITDKNITINAADSGGAFMPCKHYVNCYHRNLSAATPYVHNHLLFRKYLSQMPLNFRIEGCIWM